MKNLYMFIYILKWCLKKIIELDVKYVSKNNVAFFVNKMFREKS